MASNKGGGTQVPPLCYDRPVLVCGNAACLHDDLEAVRHLNAPAIVVNGAAAEVKAVALYSKHPDRLPKWIEQQHRKFGPGFTVYAARHKKYCMWVNTWMPEVWGGGGSAWDARKLAAYLGYGPVILCGCPMEPGPYVGNHNIGGFMHREDVVSGFCEDIKNDLAWHAGACSLSGYTRNLLGSLDDYNRMRVEDAAG